MITLYGVYRSRAARPLWMLAETGMEFTHVPVIQAYRLSDATATDAPFNTLSPAFMAINPQGQIPVMTDGHLVLTESLAITLYLAKCHGGALGPADDAELAQMMNWTLQAATSIEELALPIQLTIAKGQQDTAKGRAVIAAAAKAVHRPFARLNAHFAGQDYLVGNRFTVADLNSAECVRYAQLHPTLLSEYPALKAWLERCQARPAFQAMWKTRAAEPA